MPEDHSQTNFYRCPDCGEEWQDEWSCGCDDDCPECGARHISPYKSEDDADCSCSKCGRA
jgi:DNA-directed RNA polymerase subunit M/transcription elongation factor TFIIS